MPRTSSLLWILPALLLLAVAFVTWTKIGPVLGPEEALLAPLNGDCDLRKGPCAVAFPDGSEVVFEITPRHIPAVERLELGVRAEGFAPRRVEVDFSGVDMSMGFNRVTLEAVESGGFAGTGMLPVCVRSRMNWEAKVLLHTDAGLMAAPFRFDTYRPGREPPAEDKGARSE